jgi:predicted pyridoxine 5'-phosphate oxidase superfamily flavin-nucleotide-binding protein
MRREITTVEDLRDIVGHPNAAVKNKVGDRLSAVQKDWLAHSPLGFVATTDAAGRLDVSPKGDPPGFVHVVDDTTIVDDIDIQEVFFHCGKAFLRSDTWDAATWNPTALPTVAQIAKAIKKDMSMEELEKYYSEDNLRKILY